jgi:hypothetical protein
MTANGGLFWGRTKVEEGEGYGVNISRSTLHACEKITMDPNKICLKKEG